MSLLPYQLWQAINNYFSPFIHIFPSPGYTFIFYINPPMNHDEISKIPTVQVAQGFFFTKKEQNTNLLSDTILLP